MRDRAINQDAFGLPAWSPRGSVLSRTQRLRNKCETPEFDAMTYARTLKVADLALYERVGEIQIDYDGMEFIVKRCRSGSG